jgi:hypothetical protein
MMRGLAWGKSVSIRFPARNHSSDCFEKSTNEFLEKSKPDGLEASATPPTTITRSKGTLP